MLHVFQKHERLLCATYIYSVYVQETKLESVDKKNDNFLIY